jgi:hypothetical protein
MTLCQCDKLHTLAQKEGIVTDEYRADLSADKLRECWFEVIKVARQGDFQGPPGRTCNVFDFLQAQQPGVPVIGSLSTGSPDD